MSTRQPKPWYKSKTLWLNAIAAGLMVIEANFHLMQGQVGDKAYVASVGVLAFLNMILRAVTTEAVAFKGGQ